LVFFFFSFLDGKRKKKERKIKKMRWRWVIEKTISVLFLINEIDPLKKGS